ncbi:MlaD family protein [Paraconexibacter sp.]|uniref:MlaD family protein n=1 Tax=Paraconexibacter sp. TaxID=2949640 RepID=UPI00356130C5
MARDKSQKRTVPRKDRTGADPFLVGFLVLLAAVVGTYFGFAKDLPFTSDFKVRAVFESANSIRPNSPVRIAGVNVGKVVGIDRQDGTNAATLTMEVKDKGLPLHKDATLKIRPRIFLEGNFFVDVEPGTPGSPTIDDGDTLPITQTATPVQLDEILTTLQNDTREDLKTALDGFGTALTYEPTGVDDRGHDPVVHGKSGAQALNDSYRTGGRALKNLSIVNEAMLGTEPRDLSKLIKGLGRVTAALATRQEQLGDLVSNLNTTMGSLASEQDNLRATVRTLAPTLETANRTFASLNAAFPSTRAFAREILPGVRETAPTITASFPWITQTRRLLGPDELQGLAQDLRPTTAALSKVVDVSLDLFPQADLVSKCLTRVVLPTGDIKIDDGTLSTDRENYKEFWYAMVGLAGEGQNVDGNGMMVRFMPGGGDQTISSGKVGGATGDVLFSNASARPLGTRPAFPGKRPPYNSDAPCFQQKIPDLNGAAVGKPDGGGSAAAARTAIARRSARSAEKTARSDEGSLTSEIVERLNPFRGIGGAK